MDSTVSLSSCMGMSEEVISSSGHYVLANTDTIQQCQVDDSYVHLTNLDVSTAEVMPVHSLDELDNDVSSCELGEVPTDSENKEVCNEAVAEVVAVGSDLSSSTAIKTIDLGLLHGKPSDIQGKTENDGTQLICLKSIALNDGQLAFHAENSAPLSFTLPPTDSSMGILQGGMFQNLQIPGISSAQMNEEPPLYVNAKQYRRIMKRREARAKLEARGLISNRRQGRYLFESRHKHAKKRERGPGGKFLSKAEKENLKHNENLISSSPMQTKIEGSIVVIKDATTSAISCTEINNNKTLQPNVILCSPDGSKIVLPSVSCNSSTITKQEGTEAV